MFTATANGMYRVVTVTAIAVAVALITMVSNPETALAVDGTVGDDEYSYALITPVNAYAGNNGYNVELDIYEQDTNLNNDIVIQRMDEDNEVVEDIRTFTITENDDSISWDIPADIVDDEEAFPFRIYDESENETLTKQFVADEPDSTWSDVERDHQNDTDSSGDNRGMYASAIGDAVYNYAPGSDEYMHDTRDVRGQTYNMGDDEFILWHYQVDTGGCWLELRNLNGTTELIMQKYEYLAIVSGYDSDDEVEEGVEYENNFVVLHEGDELPGFLDEYMYDNIDFNTGNPGTLDMDEGIWEAFMTNSKDRVISAGESHLITTDEYPIWNLSLDDDLLSEGDLIEYTATISSSVAEFFNTQGLNDTITPEDYSDLVEDEEGTYSIDYEAVVEDSDETGMLVWTLDAEQEYEAREEVDFGSYTTMVDGAEYELDPTIPLSNQINDLLENYGLDDTFGGLIISTIAIVAISIFLLTYGAGSGLIGIVSILVLAAFTAIGLLPLWTMLLVALMAIALMAMAFRRGGE